MLIERDKVSAVSSELHNINELRLPQQVKHQVKCLFLSNNYIQNLHGITAFSHVQILSLVNNALRYLEELQPLSSLPCLKRISLSGNAVTKLPYYQETLISLCSEVESLDGQKINELTRTELKIRHKHAALYYSRAASNATRNSILQHIIQKVQYHEEMHRVFGKLRSVELYSCYYMSIFIFSY